jgi:pre-mRNA cleavage complex 2 protein Pcf11
LSVRLSGAIQLRKLVEAGVSQDELRQILTQLRSLSQVPQPAAAAPPTATTSYQYQAQPAYPRQTMQSAFPPPVSQQSPSTTYTSYALPSINQPKSEPVDSASLLSSVKTTGVPSTDIAGLYSALLKAGIVAGTGTPVGAGATATSEDTVVSSTSSENLSRDAARAYRKSVLSQNIRLTNTDITRYG